MKPPTSACSSPVLPPQTCPCPWDMNHSVCLSPIPHYILAQPSSAHLPRTLRWPGRPVLSPQSLGRSPQAHEWDSLSHLVYRDIGQGHSSSSQRDHNGVQVSGMLLGAEMLLDLSHRLRLETLGCVCLVPPAPSAWCGAGLLLKFSCSHRCS